MATRWCPPACSFEGAPPSRSALDQSPKTTSMRWEASSRRWESREGPRQSLKALRWSRRTPQPLTPVRHQRPRGRCPLQLFLPRSHWPHRPITGGPWHASRGSVHHLCYRLLLAVKRYSVKRNALRGMAHVLGGLHFSAMFPGQTAESSRGKSPLQQSS